MKTTSPTIHTGDNLVCPNCGNSNRFIEVMAEEAHIVNGRRDYVRLLAAVVDHYLCCDCGETIELGENGVALMQSRRKS